MEKTVKLNKAFHNFTQASKSLETYYARLSEKVQYLTQELERKNCLLRESKGMFQKSFQITYKKEQRRRVWKNSLKV